MTVTIAAIFADADHVQAVLPVLERLGLPKDRITVLGKNNADQARVDSAEFRRHLCLLDAGGLIVVVAAGRGWTIVRDTLASNGAIAVATSGAAPPPVSRTIGADADLYSAHSPVVGAGEALAIRRGTPVITTDDRLIGTVDGFEEDMLLLDAGVFDEPDLHIPFTFVDNFAVNEVRLRLSLSQLLDQLGLCQPHLAGKEEQEAR